MATLPQLPATLDISLIPGDELQFSAEFNRDLTGYTFDTSIHQMAYVPSSSGRGGLVLSQGASIGSFALSVLDASQGRMVLGLSEATTALLSTNEIYRWNMRWVAPGSVTRTVISGQITARAP